MLKYGHLCLREEILSFINNYIIDELLISVINLYQYIINHVSTEALTTGRMIPSDINSPPAEESTT